MIRRILFPLAFGAIGVGVLIGLGVWQLARLQVKEAYLANLAARIADAPMALPENPVQATDRFMPVIVTGEFTDDALNVLVSRKEIGPGVRIIAAFLTDTGRKIMVDRGFVAEDARAADHTPTVNEVTGNLHWPVEVDSFTPPPDAVGEFRVVTNNPSAEYGRAAGATVNVAYRSGTNQLHGFASGCALVGL